MSVAGGVLFKAAVVELLNVGTRSASLSGVSLRWN